MKAPPQQLSLEETLSLKEGDLLLDATGQLWHIYSTYLGYFSLYPLEKMRLLRREMLVQEGFSLPDGELARKKEATHDLEK